MIFKKQMLYVNKLEPFLTGFENSHAFVFRVF